MKSVLDPEDSAFNLLIVEGIHWWSGMSRGSTANHVAHLFSSKIHTLGTASSFSTCRYLRDCVVIE